MEHITVPQMRRSITCCRKTATQPHKPKGFIACSVVTIAKNNAKNIISPYGSILSRLCHE